MKKIVNKYIVIFSIGLIISCDSKKLEFGNAGLSQKIELTNINDLMKNPTEFDNDTLKIIGEFHLTMENRGVYWKSKQIWIDSFKPATELDSVWKNMNEKKVKIIGLYKAGKAGHLGLYDGQFKEIYYIRTE